MNIQSPHVAQRAALYLRVSTTRQAEHDVSIPDQRKQGETYCASRGYELVETFVEAGASATNDKRPEFQRMIDDGTSKPAPFDVIVVHSFSRFFQARTAGIDPAIPVVTLATAHPAKFRDAVERATGTAVTAYWLINWMERRFPDPVTAGTIRM